MNALVIDDSRAMRMILGRMLRELGMEVAEAANGRLALDLLDEGLDPGVVLVDWNMPEMTGIEFVDAVRQPPYLSTARIVMVTTETEVPQIAQALEAGADEYVMKPFTKESIFEKLQLLGNRDLSRVAQALPVAVTRVLVVDDSVVVRRVVTRAFANEPAVEVVGTARNGRDALAKLEVLRPDVVILDLDMPVMDGFETLAEIRRTHPRSR